MVAEYEAAGVLEARAEERARAYLDKRHALVMDHRMGFLEADVEARSEAYFPPEDKAP